MAHELEIFTDGTASYVDSRPDAWHRLGTVADGPMTALELLRKARLAGWDVRTLPLYATELTANGVTRLEVPSHFATARTSPETGATEILGVVGSDYHVVQNEASTELLDEIVGQSGGANFETAGSLRGGRETFVTMKLPRVLTVNGDAKDDLELYLAAMSSHDGSAAWRVVYTSIRIVCANTLRMAMGNNKGVYVVRHTASARARISEARTVLGLAERYGDAFERAANKLAGKPLDTEQFSQVVKLVWKPTTEESGQRARTIEAKRNAYLTELFVNADTQANIRWTAWGGLNAITEYLDHYSQAPSATVRATRALSSQRVQDRRQIAYDALVAI